MSERLDIDLDELKDLAKDLKTVIKEFKEAKGGANKVAKATGHESLKDEVNHFACSWSIRREHMLEDVKTLKEHIDRVVEEFTAADAQLAAALSEGAAGDGGGGGGGG